MGITFNNLKMQHSKIKKLFRCKYRINNGKCSKIKYSNKISRWKKMMK